MRTAPGSRRRGRPISQLGAPGPQEVRDLPRSPRRHEVRLDSTLRRPGSSALHLAASASRRRTHCHRPRAATWQWGPAVPYRPGEPRATSDGDGRGKTWTRAALAASFSWTPRFFDTFLKSSDPKTLCVFFFFPDLQFKKILWETIGSKRNIFQSPSNEQI